MGNKREAIIDNARKIIGKFGVKKTTIDDIAYECKMSKSSLYYYFKNKEEIIKAVIKREYLSLKETLLKELNKKKKPAEKIKTYIITRTKYIRKAANHYFAIRDVYLEQYSFILKEREKFENLEIGIINSILKEGVDKGVFEIEDIELTSKFILMSLIGLDYPLIIKNMDSEKIIFTFVNEMIRILINGIEKR